MGRKKTAHESKTNKKTPARVVQQAAAQLPTDYGHILALLKQKIVAAKVRATLAANSELILLFWDIGREILHRQKEQGWGAKVIDRLADDLRGEFPQMKGLSPRNLKYMRAFAEAYEEREIVQQVAAQIPWTHNMVLLDKLEDTQTRTWYAQKTSENGWSRAVLTAQIESGLHLREGSAITNFQKVLPAPESDLAQQAFKDPYVFDFLNLSQKATERELEDALVDNVQRFLLEMGKGQFAFVGRQYPLTVDGEEFFLDLLFYHLHLHCYVVVELKVGKFTPEFAGKMNFYLAAVDGQIRREEDAPTIGLILCKERNRMVAKYALSEVKRPIGVATWTLTPDLPDNLKAELPSVREIEKSVAIATVSSTASASMKTTGIKISKAKEKAIKKNLKGLGF